LIDGHNVIGQIPDIALDDPNDEALLIQKLNGWTARSKSQVLVIFDNGLPGGPSRLATGRVKVRFAPHNRTADDTMKNHIPNLNPKTDWVVVSDDRNVIQSALYHKLAVMRATDFVILLRTPIRPAKPTPDIDPNLKLSADQVDDWLHEFGED
jgi:predicted RNA-binding protein with PIN domain